MNKHYVSNAIAIISCLGIMSLMMTHFFGGIFIWILILWFVFIPIIILYVISFFETLIDLFSKGGFFEHKPKVYVHIITLGIIILFNVYDLECFRSKRILSATFYDDFGQDNLILRENGDCEVISSALGIKSESGGSYHFKGDTILFSKVPDDIKELIPDTILYDKHEKAIFIERDDKGKFIRKKELLNHFGVDSLYTP